tara:strand:+ start:2999 stop:3616 length:618 start_codon:yes stop_codon:yes gene_type:complete
MSGRFRPEGLDTASDGSKFLGYVPVGITSYEDRADQFDWADVYIVCQLSLEGSQYPQEMRLAGSFDREPNGNIKTCTILKRLYWLFDTIGFDGGPDVQGNMVDGNGESIDLVSYLNSNHITSPVDPEHGYLAYLYKEQGRKDPSKTYTTVFPKLVENSPAGRKDLEGYINFMKSKNLIKEVQQGVATNNVVQPNGGIPEMDDAPF